MSTELKAIVEFDQVLRSRRSVRKYDASWQMSQEEIKELLEEAILAPSSSNLQPWRFIVVTDPELKAKLLPIAYNQQQVVDASATIVVLGDLEAYQNVGEIYKKSEAEGNITAELAAQMAERTSTQYAGLPEHKRREIALIDGGLISMQLMLAAKAKGYDTVPMGGYNQAQLIELFGISERYVPVMLISLGKAAVEGRKTSRLGLDTVAQWNGFEG